MEDNRDPEVMQEVKELMKTDPAAAAEMIKLYLEKKKNIPLHIGITGESGAGKSSFVNAFRGMSDEDEGAAPTGCVECTPEPKPYPHPHYPNVILWDLPGVGALWFPADTYAERVELEKFDFFIIISDTRFRENDVKLAKEIKKMGKKFYFVRSKVDNDLYAEERRKKEFNAENCLSQIRENCIHGLQKQGFESPQVFLISNFHLHLYDFSLLHETLERELPEHKRHVLLLAMPNISLEVINKKKEAFQANIKYYAAASAAGAAIPVPGLSVSIDLTLLVFVVQQYITGFCLDAPSLQRLSATTGVPFNDLEAVLKSTLAKVDITKDLIMKLLTQLAGTSALMAAEEWSRLIPLLGIPVAMTISFITTYNALNFFLNELANEAQSVFIKALRLNTSV